MLKLPFATRAPQRLGYDDSMVRTVTILASLDTRHRIAGEMLIAGVALQRDTKNWSVFSHDGDEIGTLSTHVIETMRKHFKRHGHRPVRINNAQEAETVTFGFNDTIDHGLMQILMKRHCQSPKNIQ